MKQINNQAVLSPHEPVEFQGDDLRSGHAVFLVGQEQQKIFVKPDGLKLLVRGEAEIDALNAGHGGKPTIAAESTAYRLTTAAQQAGQTDRPNTVLKGFAMTPADFPRSGALDRPWRPVLDQSGVPVPRNDEGKLLTLQEASVMNNQKSGPRSFSRGGPNDPAKREAATV